MNSLVLRFSRQIAACLVFFVAAQMSEAAALPLQDQQQQQTPAQQPSQAQQAQPAQQQQPATPAQDSNQQAAPADTNSPQAPAPANQPAPNQQAAPDQSSPGFASRSQDGQQDVEQRDSQKPVGTAVGPYARPSGIAGSRPAGAAIAPAKQRRVKALLIRVGLIVAGAAAAGAVVGLSKQSPSRP